MFSFIWMRVHGGTIPSSKAECFSLVFNESWSKYNIANNSPRQEISQLRKKLDMLEGSPRAKSKMFSFAYSQKMGSFSNIASVDEFFRIYVNINITLMVHEGGKR